MNRNKDLRAVDENSAGLDLDPIALAVAVDDDGWEVEIDDEREPSAIDAESGLLVMMSRCCHDCVFNGPSERLELGPGRLKELTGEIRERGDFLLCHNTYEPLAPPSAQAAACRGFADAFGTDSAAIRIARIFGRIVEVDPPDPEANGGTK
ncbi:hypothetical protein ABH935_007024 [Catenulispora sp. GAS73]|uniref:hypothetical protein n=1 Tax=Catenulispora sp. GAS73 TaxID=3156269 RepID=UPI003511F944